MSAEDNSDCDDAVETYGKTNRMEPIIIVAQFENTSQVEGALTIRKDDEMDLLDENDCRWGYVRLHRTNQNGFVPLEFVAERAPGGWLVDKLYIEFAKEWLERPGVPPGGFMITQQTVPYPMGIMEPKKKGTYLTIRTENVGKYAFGGTETHEIKRLPNNRGYYMYNREKPYATLHELVAFHSKKSGLFFPQLTMRVAVPTPKPPTLLKLPTIHIQRPPRSIGNLLGSLWASRRLLHNVDSMFPASQPRHTGDDPEKQRKVDEQQLHLL